jgi:hypothetical protein
MLAAPWRPGGGFSAFLEGLPRVLAAADLLKLVDRITDAIERKRGFVVLYGGHVVKCGLTPVLADLAERGWITALATNGAGSIHDVELALVGRTSEDVEKGLADGTFGMAEETGRLINEWVTAGVADGLGYGESLARGLDRLAPPHVERSLIRRADRAGVPITVHVAVGTDITHQHPACDAAAVGAASHTDFRILAEAVRALHDGGVVLNLGSAVVLPEVFLKALTVARNLHPPVEGFTAADFDMIRHYRPTQNVVRRPTRSGGEGLTFTGHHELMIPLLAAALVERLGGG